jgi:lipid-A-disaccharide synthase
LHDPNVEIRFWGGPALAHAAGKAPDVDLKQLSVMGFVEILRALPRMLRLLRTAMQTVLEWNPDMVLLVDFQSFNAQLAKRLTQSGYRKKGGKIVQYIAPAAWAWKPGRVHALRAHVDVLVPILPFEPSFFGQFKIPTWNEGHPVLDVPAQEPLGLDGGSFAHSLGDRPVAALLPGSRVQEIKTLLPLMAEVARQMPEYQWVVAGVPHVDPQMYGGADWTVVVGQTEALVRAARVAVVASGTATLEVALWNTPEVVVYRVHPVSYWLAKQWVRVKYVSLVNLVLDRPVVPELLQHEAVPGKVVDAVRRLEEPDARQAQLQAFAELRTKLGAPGVSNRLAERAIRWLRTGIAGGALVFLGLVGGNAPLNAQAQTFGRPAPSTDLVGTDRLPALVAVLQFSSSAPSRVQVRPLLGDFALLVKRGDFANWDTVERALGWVKSSYFVERSGSLINVGRTGEPPLASGVSAVSWVPLTNEGGTEPSYGLRSSGSERRMHGTLVVQPRASGLMPVAYVPVDDYVAGVVEAEGGTLFHPTYYRAQAIIARTWLLRNQRKHAAEGYMVSDGVGSQVFHGLPKGAHASDIVWAAHSTRDSILVDAFGRAIEAVFHANSGGYTSRSEEVWSKAIPYLIAQPDTFSLRCPQTHWTKRLDKEAFVRFFAQKMGQSSTDAAFRQAVLSIAQGSQRSALFVYGGKTLKLREVREKFGLRSTYFTVEDAGSEVVLRGKGFGHGVGLSQEGAYRMARLGYRTADILAHYYPGTRLAVAR